ncbi:MAG: hypothetical protein WCA08_02215 [Desulfoferrobacter sp.]
MLKVQPHPDYPPEEGRYSRGKDDSCVALTVVLNARAEAIPAELQRLVEAGIDGGAALAGTVQTENTGVMMRCLAVFIRKPVAQGFSPAEISSPKGLRYMKRGFSDAN